MAQKLYSNAIGPQNIHTIIAIVRSLEAAQFIDRLADSKNKT